MKYLFGLILAALIFIPTKVSALDTSRDILDIYYKLEVELEKDKGNIESFIVYRILEGKLFTEYSVVVKFVVEGDDENVRYIKQVSAIIIGNKIILAFNEDYNCQHFQNISWSTR